MSRSGLAISAPGGAPPILGLAAHPLRWRLLWELARSDRRVGELCALLGEPQSLVSYHLARLRDAGAVTCRRSAADGREVYYAADLVRLGRLLADGGRALHPGLRLAPHAGPAAAPRGASVLFLCTGNSARSQIAEALTRARAPELTVTSAGSHPKPLHPNTLRVLRARGLAPVSVTPRGLDELAAMRFDLVVSLCDRVREICPPFRGARLLHWSIADPARVNGDASACYRAFERTTEEIARRVEFLLALVLAGNARVA